MSECKHLAFITPESGVTCCDSCGNSAEALVCNLQAQVAALEERLKTLRKHAEQDDHWGAYIPLDSEEPLIALHGEDWLHPPPSTAPAQKECKAIRGSDSERNMMHENGRGVPIPPRFARKNPAQKGDG